jgi:FAD binding domain in molybdopterin dehydrogenase
MLRRPRRVSPRPARQPRPPAPPPTPGLAPPRPPEPAPPRRPVAAPDDYATQRTRCLYFRDVSAACNRRTPGAGCAAIGGHNRMHAILGTSQHCVATHPSDLAVALLALDAVVVARDTSGERRIPLADLFRQPGDSPHQEHNLPAHHCGVSCCVSDVRSAAQPSALRASTAAARRASSLPSGRAHRVLRCRTHLCWTHRHCELFIVAQRPRPHHQRWARRRGRQAGAHRGQLAAGEPV